MNSEHKSGDAKKDPHTRGSESGLSLAAWRAQHAPINDVLPSGLKVRLRRISMASLVTSGQMPLPLLAEISDTVADGGDIDTATILQQLDKYLPMMDAVVKAAMDSPPISDEPDEDSLGIDELDLPDKSYIMNRALSGVDALRPFRPTDGVDGTPALHSQRVRDTAE